MDELADVLDPEWPGPVPYSILIDQEGHVLYRKLGKIYLYVYRLDFLDTITRH
tara:strand:+ start:190 stop:348 length:159 start_codon:yes stop_codon:yes gene_type:complete